MPHTNQNSIIDPVETACTADLEVDTSHAAAKSPKYASLLRLGGVSANEVVVGSMMVSQVLDRDHLQKGIAFSKVVAPTKLMTPMAQPFIGLGPQYFVTEPVENNLLLKGTHINKSVIGSSYGIGIEEISRTSSPTKSHYVDQAIDKYMASFFKDLSIKRKASEALVNTFQPKKCKINSAGVTGNSLLQTPKLKGRLARNISRMKSPKHSKSRNSLPHDITAEEEGTLVQVPIAWDQKGICKQRNNFVFNHHPIDPAATIYTAGKECDEFTRSFNQLQRPPSFTSPAHDVPRLWSPPMPGRLKANYDVALKLGSSSAYMVVLLQNFEGYLVDGVIRLKEVGSVMQGEAMSIRWAYLLTRDLNLSQVEIVGDNKEVICLYVSEDDPPWSCAIIIEDIRRLAL
ncbi:hypothetical protein LOK49_LG15G01604 [Camellia lanceoleosa]|uniref:Uncharacterized protein n=1 Tax=Camellia lanceoleosa TaxID=1840588 RepID=A0ACC0F4H3_9ERIC|nr:hypothetical protein LOK49_LG15G01604 [Camellia lanceoleosa]